MFTAPTEIIKDDYYYITSKIPAATHEWIDYDGVSEEPDSTVFDIEPSYCWA